jgi:hypothetical protein
MLPPPLQPILKRPLRILAYVRDLMEINVTVHPDIASVSIARLILSPIRGAVS